MACFTRHTPVVEVSLEAHRRLTQLRRRRQIGEYDPANETEGQRIRAPTSRDGADDEFAGRAYYLREAVRNPPPRRLRKRSEPGEFLPVDRPA